MIRLLECLHEGNFHKLYMCGAHLEKGEAKKVEDFSPSSVLNASVKIIYKVLAS